MDSQTHVEFAHRLLAVAGCNPAYAVVSLFPQIDRYPPTLHRLYAHTVFKARDLTDVGLQVLAGLNPPDEGWSFAERRFRQERARMLSYWKGGTWPRPGPAGDDRGGVLAFVSHLYLDAYNQPTQVFAPASVHCSGQWALWERIGEFRLQLYTTSLIDALRGELFADPLWHQAARFDAVTLTQAMLIRLVQLSLQRVSGALIDPAMEALGADTRSGADCRPAIEFLEEFENVLGTLHEKYLLCVPSLGSEDLKHVQRRIV